MKIAVIGGGVSGLTAAWRLHERHEVTLFEREGRLGGHAHTVEVEVGGARVAVDVGFIVFNRANYPHFCALLDELGVSARPSTMSFGVADARSGIEYNATSINALFAQRRNLLRPAFWGMLRDVFRFFGAARALARDPDAPDETFAEFLRRRGFGADFVERHVLPMCAALWSTGLEGAGRLPARFVCAFFDNHAFLQATGRPPWLTIAGGSRVYVDALTARLGNRVRRGAGARMVRRDEAGVEVFAGAGPERFDRVVFAVPSDVALGLLEAPTAAERAVLGAFSWQPNDVALHVDASVMPRSRRAWNFHVPDAPSAAPTVTYWMNALQGLPTAEPLFVTLNRTAEIRAEQIRARLHFRHPVFDRAAAVAQRRRREISGHHRTAYAGAWWGYGFHEDGARSAHEAVRDVEAAA
jgi:predicted NAD/FAD-binding protein